MDEIHIHEAPEASVSTDEALILEFVKSTLETLKNRGLTPAQSVILLFGRLPHLQLENPTWTSAKCIVFLEIQRIFELRGEYENPFLDNPEGH